MKYLYSVLIVLCVMSLFACDQKKTDTSYKTCSQEENSTTAEIVKQHIEQLGKKRWDSNAYHRIMYKEIDSMDASQNIKDGLRDTLNFVYKGVLVFEVDTILNKECSKDNHSRLDLVVNELKGLKVSGWCMDSANVMKDYNMHQDQLSFVSKEMLQKQTPRSLSDKYDEGFENRIKTKANAYLSEGIKCGYISERLKNTDKVFKSRRWHYCNELVKIYCRQTSYQPREETKLKSVLNSVNKSIDKRWTDEINDFKNSFQAK